MKRLLVLMALSGLFFSAFPYQDSTLNKKVYQLTKISNSSPIIDGSLDDRAWEQSEWAGDFVQHMPYSGKSPTFQTRFKICHDEDFIYVAIEAFDPATDSIVKRMTRRDDLDGDWVFIDFDSYHDLRTAFAFGITAGGVKGDFLISNDGQNNDETWDPVWWAKTSIGEKSWIAELKIPFSQLRFDNSDDGIWGIEVGRYLFRKDEMSFWQHIPSDAPGIIHLFGELHGMKDVKPRKQAEIIPYATAGVKKYEADPENPFLPGQGSILNSGVDAKIGITNNLTLDLSLNPDFGQVEADPSEVNLTAYESFFEEKRPLFIEGKSIYNFPLRFGDGGGGAENLFYSRRIGRPPHYDPELRDGEYSDQPEQTNIIAAAKISGKTKQGTSIGVLESVTAQEFATIEYQGEQNRIPVEPLTNYFVARVSQDLRQGNTILGGIVTSTYRDIQSSHLSYLPVSATTGGIDFQQFWGNKSYNVKFVNYVSHITGSEEAITELQESPAHLFQRPDADYVSLDSNRTSLSGFGGNLQVWKTSGNFNFLAALVWKSPGLELNDMGYFRMGDEIMDVLWVGYNFYEPFSIFRRLHFNFDQYRAWDFGGNLAVGGIEGGTMMVFKNFWSAHVGFNLNGDTRLNSYLRGGPSIMLPGKFNLYSTVSSDDRKKLAVEPSFRMEKGFIAEDELTTAYSLEFEYRPINALNISVEPEFMKMHANLQYVTQLEQDGQNRYVFSSLDQNVLSVSLRANLTLSPELTIQYWGQPFVATGNYHDYKHITNGLADNFYDRYHEYGSSEIQYNEQDNMYTILEEGSGLSYSLENPDFNVKEFLSNMVIRWEYRPGSFIYAVWSQSRNSFDCESDFSFREDVPAIWNIKPCNVFLLKVSYRLGR